MQVDLPYLWKTRQKRRTYWYYRRDGQTQRLRSDYLSPEFLEEYHRIHASFETPERRSAKPGSLKAVIDDYKSDGKFTQIQPSTKRDYLRYLAILEETYGHLPAGTLHRPAVFAIRKKYKDTPRTANGMVQIISILMQHAIDMGLRQYNPALKIKPLDGKYEHRPWEEEEIAAFRKHWPLGTLERAAFEVALNTGQRGSDIVKMEHSHVSKENIIAVRQLKTSTRVWIPISIDLGVALQAWEARQKAWTEHRLNRKKPLPVPLEVTRMLMTGEKGRKMTSGYFQHLLIDAFKEVEGLARGMEAGGVTTHGLRFTAATRLRELGCDWDVIAAITGHDTAEMVAHYTELKRKAKLAIAALNAAGPAPGSDESEKPSLEK